MTPGKLISPKSNFMLDDDAGRCSRQEWDCRTIGQYTVENFRDQAGRLQRWWRRYSVSEINPSLAIVSYEEITSMKSKALTALPWGTSGRKFKVPGKVSTRLDKLRKRVSSDNGPGTLTLRRGEPSQNRNTRTGQGHNWPTLGSWWMRCS